MNIWKKVDKNKLPKGNVIIPSIDGNNIAIGYIHDMNHGLSFSGILAGDSTLISIDDPKFYCDIQYLLLQLD